MPEIEIITHNEEQYARIDPETLVFEAMDYAQKVTDVFAFQLPVKALPEALEARLDVADVLARGADGEWLVCNLANVDMLEEGDKLHHCDVKLLPDDKFNELYRPLEEGDGSTYSDYDPAWKGAHYKHLPQIVRVARVPFNFALLSPWGQEQFVRAGGYVVYNPHTGEGLDIYGIEGAHRRKAGQFEHTYTKIGDGNMTKIDEHYKQVIAADRSPISGVQFNNEDLARAYSRIGKDHMAEKFK